MKPVPAKHHIIAGLNVSASILEIDALDSHFANKALTARLLDSGRFPVPNVGIVNRS